MDNIYDEEKEYLYYVNKCINIELESANENLETLKKQRVTYDDAKRGEQFTKDAMIQFYLARIRRLKQIASSPYFARMDFQRDGSNQQAKLYVGKTSITDESNHLAVIDWRSPIASMYYDSSVGQAQYLSPSGIISGFISLKRQIVIEDALLKNVLDADLVTNDKILQQYLDVHADNKMKNIVASIQKEQNEIIRYKENKNIIVQGIAGSGKTSVALHRIAYLIYLMNNSNNTKKVQSDQFMIIGPNNYFLDYISGVLPDLEVESVSQNTIYDLVKNLIDDNLKILDYGSELQEYYKNRNANNESNLKNSRQYQFALDKYVSDILTYFYNSDILAYDKIIFSHEYIGQYLTNFRGEYREKILGLEKLLIKKVKENYEKYSDLLTEDIRKKALSLPRDSEERKLLYDKITLINKDVKTGLSKTIKKHFGLITNKIFQHYVSFVNDMDKYIDSPLVEPLKQSTLKTLKKKTLTRDDIAPILYLKGKLDSFDEYKNYVHVIIDEAQDLGMFEFIVLNKIFPTATFSVFGDLNQSIFSYRSIDNWEDVKDKVFDNKCDIFHMNQSYRTTDEIMKEANKVSEYVTGTVSNDIVRHGADVQYINYEKEKELVTNLEVKLNDFVSKGYKTIAIICKTEEDASYINLKLQEVGIRLNNITSSDTIYSGGICTISSSSAKGLEFDATILLNVNERTYNLEHDIDMKLLYVSMTRALHETSVIYNGELPHILKKTKTLTLTKK